MNCKDHIEKNIDNISFINEEVKSYPTSRYLNFNKFITKEVTVKNDSYDVTKIIGSDYPKYTNKTWKEAYNALGRIVYHYDILDCENKQDMSYFYDASSRVNPNIDPWRIHDINGDGYIAEGNHRSIVCKFLYDLKVLPSKIDGLTAVHYITFDKTSHEEYMNIFNKFSEVQQFTSKKIKINVKNVSIDKDTTNNKTTEHYQQKYQIIYDNYTTIDETGKQTNYIELEEFDNIKDFSKAIDKYIKNEQLSFVYIIKSNFTSLYNNKFINIFR